MPRSTKPKVGERFIRREAQAPAGTPQQRIGWAGATEPAGYHVGVVGQIEPGFVRLFVGYDKRQFGIYRYANEAFERDWERP